MEIRAAAPRPRPLRRRIARRYRGRLRHVVLVVSLACACSPADEVAETVFDPCSTTAIAPVTGTAAEEVQSIEDALQLWAEVLPVHAEVALEEAPAPALVIEFESGKTFYRAMYWDSLGLISISRDRLQPEDYAIALAHELGHAFGLPHIPEQQRSSVM